MRGPPRRRLILGRSVPALVPGQRTQVHAGLPTRRGLPPHPRPLSPRSWGRGEEERFLVFACAARSHPRAPVAILASRMGVPHTKSRTRVFWLTAPQ